MKIVIKNIGDFTPSEYEKMYSAMSPGRRIKADGYGRESDRKLCILADHIARSLVSEYLNIPEEKVEFTFAGNGKPYVAGNDCFIGISHSGHFAAAAVSENPVGIDIEENKNRDLRILRRTATDSEIEFVGSDPQRLLMLWTLKEAHLKCTGDGISGNLKSVSFEIGESGIVSDIPGFIYSCRVTPDYIVSSAENTGTETRE